MARIESLYKSVSSTEVPGYDVNSLGKDKVVTPQAPFKKDFVPDFSRVVTSRRKSDSTPEMIQISPMHKRSYEMRWGGDGFIWWADDYGNMYGTLRTKGGNVYDAHAFQQENAPSGFVIWGLLDSDSVLRTVRATNILRANNIDTEAIVRIVEPAQLKFDGKTVSRDEYKRLLIKKTWDEDNRGTSKHGRRKVTRKVIPELTGALDDMTFYLETTAQQVSERFLDLKYASSPEDLSIIMKRVFTFYNARNKAFGLEEKEADSTNSEHVQEYFISTLPKMLARNYAKLHDIGLIHSYPHLGNVSLVGSIYDTDSVEGKALGIGDKELVDSDFIDEVEWLISGHPSEHSDGIKNLLKDMTKKGIFPGELRVDKLFCRNFVIEYAEHRGWLSDFAENRKKINSLLWECGIDISLNDDLDFRVSLGEKYGDANVALLEQKSSYRRYEFPKVVSDDRDIDFEKRISGKSDFKELKQADRERASEMFTNLAYMHAENIDEWSKNNDAPRDYFSFPKLTEELETIHEEMARRDTYCMVRSYVEGNLDEKVSNFDQRSVSSLFIGLSQTGEKILQDCMKAIPLDKSDPDFKEKLIKLNELDQIMMMGYYTAFTRDFMNKHLDWNDDTFNFEQEVLIKSAVNNFGRGIITEQLHEIFNHFNVEVILNEFSSDQKIALESAMECPDKIEPHFPKDDVALLLQIGLTGVEMREGQQSDLSLITSGKRKKDITNLGMASLHYLFSEVSKKEIKDSELKKALNKSLDSSWIAFALKRSLICRKDIDDDSYLAQKIRTTDFNLNEMVDVLNVALDKSNGDLSSVSSSITDVFEKSDYIGEIKDSQASEIVLTCIGLGVDLPDVLDPYLEKNRFAFSKFLSSTSSLSVMRERGIYERISHFPISPIYKFLSEGADVLPSKLKELFAEFSEDDEVKGNLTKGILKHLYRRGYFKGYYGTMLEADKDIPKSPSHPKDLYGQEWKIVHGDIWHILREADEEDIVDFINEELEDGKVEMEYEFKEDKMVGRGTTPIANCMPEDLYEKISPFL